MAKIAYDLSDLPRAQAVGEAFDKLNPSQKSQLMGLCPELYYAMSELAGYPHARVQVAKALGQRTKNNP